MLYYTSICSYVLYINFVCAYNNFVCVFACFRESVRKIMASDKSRRKKHFLALMFTLQALCSELKHIDIVCPADRAKKEAKNRRREEPWPPPLNRSLESPRSPRTPRPRTGGGGRPGREEVVSDTF